MHGRLSLLVLWGLGLSLVVSACDTSNTATSTHNTPIGAGAVHLQRFATGLDSPVYLTYAPGQTDRVYVVEQTGRVKVVGMDGSVRAQPFLDIRPLISTGPERGLLSIVFHPDYAHNGFFLVDYTKVDGSVVVARYHVSPDDPYRADPASARTILSVPHPVANHNGGLLLFGRDGFLYVGIGDGGAGNSRNGQRKDVLLGKILRLDVNQTSGSLPYAIPPTNPLVNQAGTRSEIWAFGLRNPWRFSFDRANGSLFIADAGETAAEEIDYQPATSSGGQNYGWAIFEGDACFAGAACSTKGLTSPVVVYKHVDGNCVVSGGYVYRGQRSPSLDGIYFFGDYCSGRIWAFPASEARDGHATAQQVLDTQLRISSFGEDAAGELYVVSLDGSVYHVTA
jgi:glucose/arabinose dehydrogenase